MRKIKVGMGQGGMGLTGMEGGMDFTRVEGGMGVSGMEVEWFNEGRRRDGCFKDEGDMGVSGMREGCARPGWREGWV